jgi:hypothetical protein
MSMAALPSGWGRSVSYVTWWLTTALLKGIAAVAALSVAVDLVIWGLTFASPSLTMPDWIFAPLFAFALLGTFVTVTVVVGFHRRRPIDVLRLIRHMPAWLVASLIVVGIVFFITGPAELFANVQGQPGYNAFTHQYYFDNHGQVIPTVRAHYLSAVATQTRGFLSFAIAITCVMLLLASAEVRRRRNVNAPHLSEVPAPQTPLPRLAPAPRLGFTMAVVGAVVLFISFAHIVQRVDGYLANVQNVNTTGVTEHLSGGPWVVFTWCETHTTDAPYECSQMKPSDIVITEGTSGSIIPTAPDPSVDHVSPHNLPAAGQLTFSVAQAGTYELRLTREVPKGVFVAQSPGTIARSVARIIVLAALGLAAMVFGALLLIRRMRWRLKDAPRVIVPDLDYE